MWIPLFFILNIALVYAGKFEEIYAWKDVDFVWPSNEIKEEYIKNGTYIKENNLILGMARWQDKLFLTIPR